jgi:Mg-chelatase subunit ChlD
VPPRTAPVEVPARVAVVSTGAPARAGVDAALRARAAVDQRAPVVRAFDGSGGLPAALAQALLAAGPRADELLAVWNHPAAVASAPAPTTVGGAFTTAAPLPFAPDALQVTALQPPQQGRPAELEITCAGEHPPIEGEVTLRTGERMLAQQKFTLPARGSARVPFTPTVAGACAVEVAVEAGGHRIRRRGAFRIGEAPPVLVVEPSGVVAAALRAQQVPIVVADALPAELDGFASIALGRALPVAEQQRLCAAVDLGLGLFATGPGLQRAGEPLRELLPLRLQANGGEGDEVQHTAAPPAPSSSPPRPDDRPPVGNTEGAELPQKGTMEVDKRAIAMVLVVDRSLSMGTRLSNGATKMSYAKTSALRTAQALGEGDRVGIVTFGVKDRGVTVLPMTAATDRAAVQKAIDPLTATDRETCLLGGLRRADELVAKTRVAVRHVVVITDGEFDLQEKPALRALAYEMRSARGITLSVISIVDARTDPDFKSAAEQLTRDGGGLFWPIDDPAGVPQLVSAEVSRALDRVGRRPGGDGPGNAPPPDQKPPPPRPQPPPPLPTALRHPVRAVATSPLLLPLPEPDWPTLGAVVAATATLDAHVLLVAGEEGSPLLAYANRGLGRVGVLAADLGSDATQDLRVEPPFPARLSQWIAALRPPLPEAPADLLTATAVEPAAPTPAEASALAALAGGRLRPFDELRLPPPRTDLVHVSRVPAWALWASLLLLVLATVEWRLARSVPR